MTKADLRNGMVVTTRNEKRYVYLENAIYTHPSLIPAPVKGVFVNINEVGAWLTDVNITENLTNCVDHGYDIMKVEVVRHPVSIVHNSFESGKFETYWERSEKKKYTYEELKEILGEEFEIVKN